MENKEPRWWDLTASFLLLLTIWISVIRLTATNWADGLNRVENLVLAGFLIGGLIGFSWIRNAFGIPLLGLLTPVALLLTLISTMQGYIAFDERLLTVLNRLWETLQIFWRDEPIQDPILFIANMGLVYWGISVLAGFTLLRSGKPWAAVFLATTALILVDYYNPNLEHRERYHIVFMLVLLLLVARINYLHSRRKWQLLNISVDTETGVGITRSAVVSGLLLVLVAWNLPALGEFFSEDPSMRTESQNSWFGLRDRISNLVAGLQGSSMSVVDYYGNYMTLGTGNPLGDDTVFRVQASDRRAGGTRYYWRGNTYDRYTDGGWNNTMRTRRELSPEEWEQLNVVQGSGEMINFTYEAGVSGMRTIYLPASPGWVSVPAIIQGSVIEDGAFEVTGVQTADALHSEDIFQIQARMDTPTEIDLRAAGTEYPDWVREYYLQIPDDLPQRVKDLALEIAGAELTPYDKAEAITEFLRKEIEYRETIDRVPSNREPIDWVLFETKQGFCNYYATAEIMLLRSIGIPARLAVGYAQGANLQTTNAYRVRVADTHAWPEVYFPNIGWVEFEPTTSQPVLSRPTGIVQESLPEDFIGAGEFEGGDLGEITRPDPEEDPLAFDFVEDTTPPPGMLEIVWRRYGFLIVAIVIIGGVSLWAWRRRVSGAKPIAVVVKREFDHRGWSVPKWLDAFAVWSELSILERQYLSLRWLIWVMGGTAEDSQTPAERFITVRELIPSAVDEADLFLTAYQKYVYSPHEVDLQTAKNAGRKLWKVGLTNRARRILGI